MRPTAAIFAAFAGCFIAQAQTPVITSLSNNATNFLTSNTISPGELLNVAGTNLGDTTNVGCGSATGFTTSCGGVSVTVSGKAAGVRSEIAGQVIIEVPVDAPLGSGQLVLTRATGGQSLVSQPFAVTVAATTPQMYINNVNGTAFAQCFNGANVLLSPATPVSPGNTVRCIGDGFGLSNPVSPTGTVASAPLPPVVATVTATIAGKNATVTSTTLQGPIVGEDQIFIVIPQGIPPGPQPLVVTVGGVSGIADQLAIAVVGPNISSISNAASNILPGLPNAPIAQGAIFIIKGVQLGPASISIASAAFQATSLSGTSVAVTVGSTTVNALMYYTSAGQVAALLPSNTPTGTGTITVTYNNQASFPQPITVVASNLGIFTIDSSGQGPGIVTYADYSLVSSVRATPCGGPSTSCGAANPGDTLILWATGLGPITGNDAKGDGLGQAQTSVPLTLWLGGVQAPVVYQGRSGCCIGEDQIVFTVPSNVPFGCAVPLIIQIGNEISNNTVMPVANGGRNCTSSVGVTPSLMTKVLADQPFNFGDIDVSKNFNDKGTGYEDDTKIQFFKVPSYVPGTEPFFTSFLDDPPAGLCLVYNRLDTGRNIPFATLGSLDGGSSLIYKGPGGSLTLSGVTPGQYNATMNAAGTFLVPGAYTVTGAGGGDVGPISATSSFPPAVSLTTPVNPVTVTRANGMQVSWTGGVANSSVEIQMSGATDSSGTNGATVDCIVPAGPGTFTIPSYAMLALPTGSFGSLFLQQENTNTLFTATGLDFAVFNMFGAPVALNGIVLK